VYCIVINILLMVNQNVCNDIALSASETGI
jgi:hypothetical protein